MPIDWTTRERALSLAYLIEGTYHDENGVKRLVHWCGPKARVGSGLSVPVPIYAGQREALTPVWEARVTRASMDMNMGNLDQTISTISDLTFNVDISGGSQASVPVVGDLRRDIVFGRWRNKACRIWLLDLDTLDTQIMGKGAFDRNPSSIGPGNFQITVDITPAFPANLDWPQGRIPLNTNDFTFDSAGQITNYFIPDQFMLSPKHAGKYTGVVFGDATIAGADYIWKELIPYGRQIKTLSSHWIYAWVSPQEKCFVHEIYFENTVDNNKPTRRAVPDLDTFENDDPTRGPLGTCVRFVTASTTSQGFNWWSSGTSRVVGRVNGPVSGQHDYFQYDQNGGNPVSVYEETGPIRSQVWNVITDAITRPWMMNLTSVLGTGAITEFKNTIPTMSPAADTPFFAALACVVPREITDRPITAREAFGSLAQFFPFDFAQRYDPATEDWRVYPVWRSAFTTPPAYVFGVEDMSKTDAPAITQYDNSDGQYANHVTVTTPGYYGVPTIASTSTPQTATNELLPIKTEKFQHVDLFEQTATREDFVVITSLEMKHWLHYGLTGNSAAAWTIGEERSQPQRTVQATHGVRSFRVEMGTAIQYELVGINSDVGMVRKMRYDFDLQQVQITSYHIDHSTRRTTQHGDNVANNHGPDTDVPDPD